jgi:hypothetical protein
LNLYRVTADVSVMYVAFFSSSSPLIIPPNTTRSLPSQLLSTAFYGRLSLDAVLPSIKHRHEINQNWILIVISASYKDVLKYSCEMQQVTRIPKYV